MEIKEFEDLINTELKKVVGQIIKDNPTLNISAKSRAGAEISDFLETEFVKYTHKHKYFYNSESSPKGATKNPWDAKTIFKLDGRSEEIWIDFKALKTSSADSNPDIGTPNKVVDFINQGFFYLVYIFVYYNETESGLEFVKNNDEYIKIYFLKDISSTFRRNPKNQLQVNMSAKPEYRSRDDFIKLLIEKITESHLRQLKMSTRELKKLETLENELKIKNKNSESEILSNINK
jgi:hypothetical protein